MEEAFIKQFAEHQRKIYAIVRSMCQRPQDADDVFQETVVVLWRKREQFEPETNFVAWAAAIARLEALAFSRKQGRRVLVFDEELTSQIAIHAAEKNPAQPRLDALRQCMQSLPQKNRALVEERYAGDSVKDLAQRLNRSVNSISVTLHTIRRKLLECIERRLAGEIE